MAASTTTSPDLLEPTSPRPNVPDTKARPTSVLSRLSTSASQRSAKSTASGSKSPPVRPISTATASTSGASRPISSISSPTSARSGSTATTASPVSPIDDASALPLSIPTKHPHITSGFPYHPALFDLNVAPKQWEAFNADLLSTLTPSRMDSLAARAARINAPPVSAVLMAAAALKRWNARSIEKRLLAGLEEDEADATVGPNADGQAVLAQTLRRWNDDVFASLGLEVQLQLTKSARARHERDVRRRRKAEMDTRAKYGTAGFYPDDEESNAMGDDVGAGDNDRSKYKILITRLVRDEQLPGYERGSWTSEAEKGTKGPAVPAMAGVLANVAEMPDTRADIAEMPAPMVFEAVELPAEVPDRAPVQRLGEQMQAMEVGDGARCELPDTSVRTW